MTTKLFDADGAFAENIRAEIPEDDTELRDSLKQFGWNPEFPAFADENGVILVGHRRMKLAEKLGIEPVIKTLRFGRGEEADAERVKLALISNIGGKPLTAKDRRHIAERLYGKDEWTMQRIAKALNVSQQTISLDLGNLPMTGKLKPAKTATNPKGAGRPKGSTTKRETPVLDKAREIVRPLVEAGEPTPARKLAKENGISHVQMETAIAVERGIIDKGAEIRREDLSLTAQEKFDAAIRAHKKTLDANFQKAVTAAVLEWGENLKYPEMEKYLADAKSVLDSRQYGMMKLATYRLIERCLHPDNTASEKMRNEAFVAFQAHKARLTSHAEAPITAPTMMTREEMMARRHAKTEKNRARARAKRGNGMQRHT